MPQCKVLSNDLQGPIKNL